MTLSERIVAYVKAYPKRPASWPWLTSEQGRDVLYAIWVIGNDYRNKTAYYGAFPHGLLDRIMALYPDIGGGATLHAFSGSLPPGPYLRCDLVQPAEFQCSVYDLPDRVQTFFRLVIADPPYSMADAVRYGAPAVNRGKALRALAQVVEPGGHLVWLDTAWPMHRKADWLTVGRILIQRSTNHRARVLSVFERVGA